MYHIKTMKCKILIGAFLIFICACDRPVSWTSGKIPVFVTLLPQAYFADRIGGDKVVVEVMVGPGQSEHTYEPTPKQISLLDRAMIYFEIGMPFERTWLDKIKDTNPHLKIVDVRQGIALRNIEAHTDDDRDAGHDHEVAESGKDPHIWLSPRLVKIQGRTMCDALKELDPQNADYYERNFKSFTMDLDQLDDSIRAKMKDLKTRKFMVFHPTWGYFADDYGLTQMPIEVSGKSPSARQLSAIIDVAKKENIKVIFVQQQFSSAQAETVAQAIAGRVMSVDPLSRDYINNLEKISDAFAEVMK